MQGAKRTADAMGFDEYDHQDSLYIDDDDSTVPQIIRRHRSRLGDLAPFWHSPATPIPETPQTPRPAFNIFKAILRHPSLFFQFALRLPPQTMMDLYSIDKEFHYRFNIYNQSLLHDYVQYHAPEASDVFSAALVKKLCISDPLLKPMDNRTHLAREIPSFRWAKMVLHHDAVVRQILTLMALEGHRVPREAMKVVMKFWVVMTLKKQGDRIAVLRSTNVWSDDDIVLFQLFYTKLDMMFAHPVENIGGSSLSHLLLTQKSLTVLRDVLSGKFRPDYRDLGEMVIRTYHNDDLNIEDHPWLDNELENNVDIWEWGMLTREDWEDGADMDSTVDIIIAEGIRRSLHVQRYYLDFILYGYVDMDTGQDIPMPRLYRGDRTLVDGDQARWMLPTTEGNALMADLDRMFTN